MIDERVRAKLKGKLGSGSRFAALKAKLAQRPGVKDAEALAAHIGRMKYGKEHFQQMAARGR